MRHNTLIAMLFVAVLLISNIVSTKIVVLGPFTFDGGTILFPLSYIFGDILTEVYGYKESRKIIRGGLICNIIMAISIMAVGYLPADPTRGGQDAYMQILGLTPRLVIASLIAYMAGEFSNSYILAKIKVKMKGKHLWIRTISSTLVGQAIDTSIFILIAFGGIFDSSLMRTLILSNYIFKVLVEVVFTPVTYCIIKYLKKADKSDVYDKDTNFNPFVLK